MKEQNEKKRVKKFHREKRFYMITSLGAALALMTIIIATVALSGDKEKDQAAGGLQSTPPIINSSSDSSEQPVVVTPAGMISPVETVTVLNEYGFYHNQTLGAYYEHAGVDFAASAGTQVLAAESGVVESIYKDDLLTGTEIVINHGDGLKTLYRFVTEVDGLKVGDKVEKGDVIACVAEANGNEYKDGSHLHFEVIKNGKSVDPAVYLTLEEK